MAVLYLSMQIIKATPADIDTLFALSWRTFYDAFYHLNTESNMKAYMEKAFNQKKLLSELENENSDFFFAKEGDSIQGYLKLNRKDAQTEFKDDVSLEVERIYIDQCYQGCGVGTQLINHVIEIAKSSGFKYVWLGVWEKNPGAIRFYERHGFEIFSAHEFVMGDEIQFDKLMICKIPLA